MFGAPQNTTAPQTRSWMGNVRKQDEELLHHLWVSDQLKQTLFARLSVFVWEPSAH